MLTSSRSRDLTRGRLRASKDGGGCKIDARSPGSGLGVWSPGKLRKSSTLVRSVSRPDPAVKRGSRGATCATSAASNLASSRTKEREREPRLRHLCKECNSVVGPPTSARRRPAPSSHPSPAQTSAGACIGWPRRCRAIAGARLRPLSCKVGIAEPQSLLVTLVLAVCASREALSREGGRAAKR